MKRKRLQHHADTLCHMFRGWQLYADYRALTELGSGTLEIDVLNATCKHNGREIVQLSIARVLRSWLRQDLFENSIPLEAIQVADLVIQLDISEQEGQRDFSISWARPARVFISCELEARSRVVTDEKAYTSEYSDRLEWPRNWAA